MGADHAERLATIAKTKAADRSAPGRAQGALGEGTRPGRAGSEKSDAARRGCSAGDRGRRRRRMPPDADPDCAASWRELNAELDTLQGETPLMRVCVDAQIVGEVISGWTGIPVGKMLKDEISTVLRLEKHLGARVIGQDHALEHDQPAHPHIAGGIWTIRASRSACSCWWGRAASARRKPRSRWPTCSTAASTT